MISETQTIGGAGGGTFTTRWAYSLRDQVVEQVYPDNETVTTAYGKWGQPASLTGTSNYVVKALPDAAGRLDLMKLGNTDAQPRVVVDYVYYPWTTQNGRGRLQQRKAGPPGTPTALQNLSYSYDAVGNVTSVQQSSPTPAETFNYTYDALDRLTGVSQAGGGLSESYTYNAIGNLTGKAGGDYSYDASHKHAAYLVKGSGGTSKTVTVRARASSPSCSPSMTLRINGTDRQTWTVSSTTYSNYSVNTTVSGKDIVNVVYTNDSGSCDLYVQSIAVDGTTIPTNGGALYDKGLGDSAYDWVDVSVPSDERMDVNGALRFAKGAGALAAKYDSNGNMVYRVVDGKGQVLGWDRENRPIAVTQGSMVNTFVYDGDGRRVKATVNGVTSVYVGSYYEVSGGTVRKYYEHWGQRVAVREGGTVYWLLSDHLGSTAVSATEGAGAKDSEVRYKPWGETRTGSMPRTTYRYTGHREEAVLGLYYANARWYDSALGRWISADTIVPEPGDPQSLNRYTYVLNKPTGLVDPAGRAPEQYSMGTPFFSQWDQKWQERYVVERGGQYLTWREVEVLNRLNGYYWPLADQIGESGGAGTGFYTSIGEALIQTNLQWHEEGEAEAAGYYNVQVPRRGYYTSDVAGQVERGPDGTIRVTMDALPNPGALGMAFGNMVLLRQGAELDVEAHEYYHVLEYRARGFLYGVEYAYLYAIWGTSDHRHPLETGAYAVRRIYEENRWLPHPSTIPWHRP